jgi:hypothetical protein
MRARTTITLRNPLRPDLPSVEVDARVDLGCTHLSVPAAIALRLGLQKQDTRRAVVENGPERRFAYVGPLLASWGRRSCFAGALRHGNEIVLGTIPMDAMDLVVLPDSSEVAPNPLHPNIPGSIAVGYRMLAQ